MRRIRAPVRLLDISPVTVVILFPAAPGVFVKVAVRLRVLVAIGGLAHGSVVAMARRGYTVDALPGVWVVCLPGSRVPVWPRPAARVSACG